MKINIREAIKFLDCPSKEDSGQSTSIIGVIGEDLNAYTFKHYLENEIRVSRVEVLTVPVTQGTNKGKRLDRWIFVEHNDKQFFYQCEIKNWAAKALGGKCLALEADKNSVSDVCNKNWKRQLKTEFSQGEYPNGVTKVLVRMKLPRGYKDIEIKPLLLYWMPISNNPDLNPYFSVPTKDFTNELINTDFNQLNIFSASLYLRTLIKKGINYLNYEIPSLTNRINTLNKICQVGNA